MKVHVLGMENHPLTGALVRQGISRGRSLATAVERRLLSESIQVTMCHPKVCV